MSNHQPHWDLSTIPDDVFYTEHGRRSAAKRWNESKVARELGFSTRAAAFKDQREWRASKRRVVSDHK